MPPLAQFHGMGSRALLFGIVGAVAGVRGGIPSRTAGETTLY
jgi:hypothetical protein